MEYEYSKSTIRLKCINFLSREGGKYDPPKDASFYARTVETLIWNSIESVCSKALEQQQRKEQQQKKHIEDLLGIVEAPDEEEPDDYFDI
jgi:hypothetical protein